jgi:two-component system sensor kinase FixL
MDDLSTILQNCSDAIDDDMAGSRSHQNNARKQTEIASHLKNEKGEITAALAHELAQPLTVIKAYAENCLRRLKNKKSNLMFPLQQIALQATHAGEIISRMKNFLCEDNVYFEETDLNALIKKTAAFLQHEFIPPFTIEFDLSENLPLIQVDRLKIMQVLINLGRNSIEAFQDNSEDNCKMVIRTRLKQDQILIHFRDNGPGIPEEIRNKVLNSYFTTKSHGTGLGLFICCTFLKAQNGQLEIKKHRGRGAWFVITLPLKRVDECI